MTEQTSQRIRAGGPGCLIRILYFLVIGLWLGGFVTVAAWVLIISIIGMPLGLWLLNNLPTLMTLRPQTYYASTTVVNGQTVYSEQRERQYPFLLRALYFIVIGFWFSLVWMLLAWLISLVILGLAFPLSFWMFNRVPCVTTLARI